ncbi:SRPBCC family protein [Natronorubrum sp. FCH18a]|uniref:SRPBCC family protein n=1 Tax=Natronorubrum sp. FCH18a TaxID=3447018 RepID=UPI003F512652
MSTDTRESDLGEQPWVEWSSTDQSSRTNVGRWERAASAVVGGALLWRGLRRRSLGATLAGGALVARGISGRSRLYRLFDVDTATDREGVDADSTTDKPTIKRSITVDKPPEELETFWRDPEQLSRIVGEFADVSSTMRDGDHHHWRVSAPAGRQFEWQTRLVEEQSGDRLRWETIGGAPVSYEATVQFRPAPGDHGTEVTLEIQYDPPGGSLTDGAMHRLGIVPESLAGTVLDRFKSLAETGEIPSLETNPSDRGKGDRL